jgi:beta-RFAP synthase
VSRYTSGMIITDEVRPFRTETRVSVPARTSICVLDMNDFRPGVAGGGNVGFAFGAPTKLHVESNPSDEVLDDTGRTWMDSRAALVRYVISRWSDGLRNRDHYRVTVNHANRAHNGLAASAALQLATWASLNHLFGHPYSDVALRRQIAHAYREAVEGTTQPAFTTGLSSFLGLYGGFAIVGTDLMPAVHVRVPTWSAAMVVPTGLQSVSFGAVEREALTTRGPKLDDEHRAAKLSILFDELVPAVGSHNLPDVGKAVAKLQRMGSKVAELQIYGDAVRSPLEKLQHEYPCAFMSAVGPGIAIITDSSRDDLHALNEAGYDVLWSGVVDNEGILLGPNTQ